MRRIGIVGGGQLGRMLTEAAADMRMKVTVVDPIPNCPAAQVGAQQIIAPLTNKKALMELAEQNDYITFEIEHIDAQTLIELARAGFSVNPHPETLLQIKDKLKQKRLLSHFGVPAPRFAEVKSPHDVLQIAKEQLPFPLILKTRFGGYDGRGNAVIRDETELAKAFEKLKGKEVYVEEVVPFVKELAVIVARSVQGNIKVYPVVETIHKNNICHLVLAPAPISKKSYDSAIKIAHETMKHLHGAGVFGIEMFLLENGGVLLNEIAPRVHNSGHFTIEACKTSQFRQHLLAVSEQDLEPTEMLVKAAVMVNILGNRSGIADPKGIEEAEKIPGVHVHMYGKAEVRPERKMGHLTTTAETLEAAKDRALRARELISI